MKLILDGQANDFVGKGLSGGEIVIRPRGLAAKDSGQHVILGNVLQEQWHWADAETEYRRALELNPNDAAAHAGLALWLLCRGRTDEAIAWARRGRQLDPLAVSGNSIAWILFQSRRYDEAKSTIDNNTPRVNETICSGSWYHEEAIHEANPSFKPTWDH